MKTTPPTAAQRRWNGDYTTKPYVFAGETHASPDWIDTRARNQQIFKRRLREESQQPVEARQASPEDLERLAALRAKKHAKRAIESPFRT